MMQILLYMVQDIGESLVIIVSTWVKTHVIKQTWFLLGLEPDQTRSSKIGNELLEIQYRIE